MSLLMTSLTHGDADALGSIKVEVEERERQTDRHTEKDRVPSIFHSTASDAWLHARAKKTRHL